MNRSYYLSNPGRLQRQQNTISFQRYKQLTGDKVIADFEEALEQEPQFQEEEPEINLESTDEKKNQEGLLPFATI